MGRQKIWLFYLGISLLLHAGLLAIFYDQLPRHAGYTSRQPVVFVSMVNIQGEELPAALLSSPSPDPLPQGERKKNLFPQEGGGSPPAVATRGGDPEKGSFDILPSPGSQSSGGTATGDPILARIRSQIESNQYYPILAQKKGLEGQVGVRFALDPKGHIIRKEITQASPFDLLNTAALTTLARAEPLPYYPGEISLTLKFAMR